MKDLIFIWESQKLKLKENFNKPGFKKFASPYVRYNVKNFQNKVRDKILDIIYNS